MQNENQGLVNHDFFGEKQVECHRRKKAQPLCNLYLPQSDRDRP